MSTAVSSHQRRVAIVATHPIQYQVPWFRGLAAEDTIDLTVYYGTLPDRARQGQGFGVAFEWDVPLLEGYRWEQLPNLRRRPRLQGFLASSTPWVAARLWSRRPDAVILTGWNQLTQVEALAASRLLRVPCLLRAESNALRQRPSAKRLAHRLLLRQFAAMLCIGEANRQFYLDHGVDSGRLFSAPYFVDNAFFQRVFAEHRERAVELRRAWGIAPEATCFCFVGKLEPKKNILGALRAVRHLVQRCPDVHLLVVGDGEQRAEAELYAAREKLPVTFAGFLNQSALPTAYVAADALVLPSDFGETWGLVVNEAMACGLPVIVSDRVGCGPDLVRDGETGFRFHYGQWEQLSARMSHLVEHPEARRQMGKAAEERVRAYTVVHAVRGTLDAIESVCATGDDG
jgi:glycosyltransferase involved in cell wall biosynthesis